jgi:hypothetical protein
MTRSRFQVVLGKAARPIPSSLVKQPRAPASTLILRSLAVARKGEGAASRRMQADDLPLAP